MLLTMSRVVRIDRDRAARAFPGHALHRRDQLVAVGIAAGLLQRLVDEMQAVIGAERGEVGTQAGSFLEVGDIGLVERRIVRRRIIAGGDEPDHLIAGTVEAVVVAEVARPDDLDAGLAEPLLLELPGEDRRQRAGKVDEGGVGLEVGDALQRRREIGTRQRNAERVR